MVDILTLGSLFDGIGGFPLAASEFNIKTIWSSEIDSNCMKLTKQKFSATKQLKDIKNVSGYNIEPVDIISFGSPCNNLSLAGNREGLKGQESKLFHEAIRIIDEMKEITKGGYPKYAIWENVTGALSSNKGQDFKCVLEEITKASIPIPRSRKWSKSGMVRGNEYSLAWRVMDAQYWGVPQSRKRIFLVADFTRRRQGAAEILFERQSEGRDIEEIYEKRKKVVRNYANNIRTTGEGKQIISTLCASYGTKWNGNSGAYKGSHFVIEYDGRLRRLIPLECERALGFPDNWTSGFKDTVRYKMLGNSIAIPCVKWIFKNIANILKGVN